MAGLSALAVAGVVALFLVPASALHQDSQSHCDMSRLSMLEYRVAQLEARELSCGPPATTGSRTSAAPPRDECSRGMGDVISQAYPPRLVLPQSALGRDVLCDTHTDGGGWIVIQRRAQGDVDFLRSWSAYRTGFGSPSGDFWLGNEAIHQLTHNGTYELRIDMRSDGQEVFARYSSFKLEPESDKYRLHLGTYSGTVGESNLGLSFQNHSAFTTFDNNNAVGTTENCGLHYRGAWWYNHFCTYSNLNGVWGVRDFYGVSWKNGDGYIYPTFTEMKIRRV